MSKTPKIFKKIQMQQIEAEIVNYINNNNLSLEGFTAPILLKHIKVLTEIIFIYLHDESNRPLSVAYSGGKDSTVTLDLVLKGLLLIKLIYGIDAMAKKTYVLFSDTLMELDPVIDGIFSSLNEVKEFCTVYGLNVQVDKVSPELKNRFFSLIIGKGYILPNQKNRYCSERMKIMPQQKKIDLLLEENNQGFVAITGQRQDESNDRKRRLEAHTIDGSFKDHDYVNCSLFTPIEHWSSNDVWDYIYMATFNWVNRNELGKVYAEASDDGDECKSLLMGFEASSPGCGKSSRWGCWICPLHFSKDKTLNNLGKKYPYLQKMEEFRNWLVDDATGQWDFKRDVFIHGKHKMKAYDRENHRLNMKLPGGYSLNYRKQILVRLMELELEVLPQRNKYLISDEELSYIQEIWIEDGDMDMSVTLICKHRNVEISPLYKKVVEAASIMQNKNFYGCHMSEHLYSESWHIVEGLNRNVCSRYYCQMALQLEKDGKDSKMILNGLRFGNEIVKQVYSSFIKKLPLETKMDFVDINKENYYREEWKQDKVGFFTFLEMYENKKIGKPQNTLFGYEGDYGTHFEALDELKEKGDITLCEQISLKDKMRFFDNW